MMVAIAIVDDEREPQRPSGAEEERRVFGGDPGTVGGEEEIGVEFCRVCGGECLESERTRFFGGLHEDLHVIAQRSSLNVTDGTAPVAVAAVAVPIADFAAQRLENDLECQRVHGVLTFIVGTSAPVEAIAVAGENPGVEALRPLRVVGELHVAVAVEEDGRQIRVLNPCRDEQRVLSGLRVVVDRRRKAQCRELGGDLLGEVGMCGRAVARRLTFGAAGNSGSQQIEEGLTADELARSLGDGLTCRVAVAGAVI